MANYNNWGGSRAGAGRKALRDESEVIDIFAAAVSRASKIRIVKAIVKKAEQGDIRAAALIMNYAFGRPIAVEKAGEEIDPDEAKYRTGMPPTESKRAFMSDVIRVYGNLDKEEEDEVLAYQQSLSAAEVDEHFHRMTALRKATDESDDPEDEPSGKSDQTDTKPAPDMPDSAAPLDTKPQPELTSSTESDSPSGSPRPSNGHISYKPNGRPVLRVHPEAIAGNDARVARDPDHPP